MDIPMDSNCFSKCMCVCVWGGGGGVEWGRGSVPEILGNL